MKQLVSRIRFKQYVKQANETAKHIQTKDITETVQLTKAVIISVANKMGLELKDQKPNNQKKKNIPPWKQRMSSTLND